MKRPAPRRNAECIECLTTKPLLMPMQIYPGWPDPVWIHVCVGCRVNWRDDHHSGVVLASTVDHAVPYTPHDECTCARREGHATWCAIWEPGEEAA